MKKWTRKGRMKIMQGCRKGLKRNTWLPKVKRKRKRRKFYFRKSETRYEKNIDGGEEDEKEEMAL